MGAMIGRRVAHYEIIESLGEGGMGVVYKALDTRLNRPVALKFISSTRAGNDAERARLVNEARAAAALRHPNICTVYDINEVDGQMFISMAYIEGQSLRDRIQAKGPLPIAETVRIAAQIAEGLREAHAHGVVHRDIKCANILLTDRGEAVILDFGMAKLSVDASITRTDTFAGTVSYASPEQIRGDHVDHCTDLWSLGVVWHEMLTGTLPFSGDSMATVIRSVLDQEPVSIRIIRTDAPADVARVVSHLLTKDPKRRTADAGALLDEIRALSVVPPAAKRAGPPSIAVLAFANMSADPEQTYFCDGIAEDIINDLTRIAGLRVAARTTSFAYREKSGDIREIGRLIGVDSVLEGSVRKAGNRLRITAQLIDVSSGYHVWSQRWDREIEDVFAIQDEIARATVAALRVRLSEMDQRGLDRRGTANIEAYDLYLRARAKMHQSLRDRLTAQELLHRAIKLDPSFARAHASLAVSSMFLYQYMTADPRYLHESLEASHQALSLDPGLAEAHAARGYALASTRRFEDAEPEFAISLVLNPDLYETLYFLARVRWVQGKMEEAVALFERAIEIDPNEYQSSCLLINLYIALKSGPAKIESVSKRALERATHHLDKCPDDTRAVYLSVAPLKALGRIAEARARVEQTLDMDPDAPDVQYNAACFFALNGDAVRALDCLERALAGGFNTREWIEHDTDLDSVRQTDRFKALMKRLK